MVRETRKRGAKKSRRRVHFVLSLTGGEVPWESCKGFFLLLRDSWCYGAYAHLHTHMPTTRGLEISSTGSHQCQWIPSVYVRLHTIAEFRALLLPFLFDRKG